MREQTKEMAQSVKCLACNMVLAGKGGETDSLTQAKSHICVPLLRVFCAVNQIVGLKKSISHAEGNCSQKENHWVRPPSGEQGINKCPRREGESD